MIQTKPCNPKEVKVALLKGGKSGEREVSLKSGAACADGLREEGFEVVEIDAADEDMIQQIIDAKPNVVFNILHGKYGEDGCVQGLCELLGIPYTASGVRASAMAMDKATAKMVYTAAGLPTPPSVLITAGQDYDLASIVEAVGEKCVVKPACEGSSLGMTILKSSDGLEDAIKLALEHDNRVLIERFVKGTETTIAVVGNSNPEALPVIEITTWDASEFYDFDAKYAAGGSTHIIPARISDELTAECQRLAVAAHKALGCRGASRTDILIDDEDNCWILETNTIPGMTQTSLLPDTASRVGISFSQLCKILVELALE